MANEIPKPDYLEAIANVSAKRGGKRVVFAQETRGEMVSVATPRVTQLPNIHRLISDGLRVIEIELGRLRQTAALGGLSSGESKQFEIYLKALPTLADLEERSNGTVAGKILNNLSQEELAIMAKEAIAELTDGKGDK